MHRTRGFSASSVESASSTSSFESDGASSSSSIDLESDNEIDEGHASDADDAAIRKLRAIEAGIESE